MAVAIENVAFDKSTGGSFIFSFTVTSANALLLIVQERHASGVTAATYDGVAFTQLSYNDPGTNLVVQKFYLLMAPHVGTHNIVLSPASVPNRTICTAIGFTGVNTTTPTGTVINSNGGPVATISDVVASATGEIVVDGAAIMEDTVSTATLAVGAGQTQRSNQEQVNSGVGLVGAVSTEPGAASVTMSWTIGTTNSFFVHSSVAVKAASGDTTPPANPLIAVSKPVGGTQISFVITMPSDADLSQYELRRLTADYPANDRSNGTVVVAPTAATPSTQVSFTDTGLTNGTRYFYRVFCKDATGNWNTGATVTEVASTALSVIGWYTQGGTFKADGETGANPIFEWVVDAADIEANKAVMFRIAVGDDNPGSNLEPTQNATEYLSANANGDFKYFSGGSFIDIPASGVPWASVNAGAVTCRWYSALNATHDLYGVVRAEQA